MQEPLQFPPQEQAACQGQDEEHHWRKWLQRTPDVLPQLHDMRETKLSRHLQRHRFQLHPELKKERVTQPVASPNKHNMQMLLIISANGGYNRDKTQTRMY
jgi:hypothetical protein